MEIENYGQIGLDSKNCGAIDLDVQNYEEIYLDIESYRTGGGPNFERRNVNRLKFRNFKVANIKITKDELFDGIIIEFIFSFF